MFITLLIPGYYLVTSRLKRLSEIFSWMIVHPLFLLLVILLTSKMSIIANLTIFLVAFVTWLLFYEIGYLENDALTIKKEKNPTLRISEQKIDFIQQNFQKLQVARLFLGVVGIAVLFMLKIDYGFTLFVFPFILCIIVARLAFYAHNHIRNRWNILTYHLLSTTKYLAIPLLFLPVSENWLVMLTVYLVFPVLRTMEHAAKIKYKLTLFQKLIPNLDIFRIRYYSLLLAIIIGYYFVSPNADQGLILLVVVGWFFAFRFATFILLKWGGYKRTKFSSHNWKNK